MSSLCSADARTERQQRILLVVRRLYTGGIEKATLNLAQGLLAAGHEVHVLLLKGDSQLPLPTGVQLHRFDIEKQARRRPLGWLLDLAGRLLLRYLFPGSGFVWRGWLSGREMQRFVEAFEAQHGTLDLLLLRGQGVFETLWRFHHPRCWQVVEGPPATLARHRWAGWFYRLLYQDKQVVTVSAGIGEVLQEQLQRFGVQMARQVVIHNALPIAEIRELSRGSVTDLPSGPFLLHVARLSAVKNQPLLLEAYAASRLTMPLVIIGQGSEEGRLRQLANQLGIAERVLFWGLKSNPYAYMARASALVLSSRQEGLGLVLIESLACGTQVVATDVPGGIREVMIEEQTRLLAENSVAGLAAKLQEAIRQPVPVQAEWADRFDASRIVPQVLRLSTPVCLPEGE